MRNLYRLLFILALISVSGGTVFSATILSAGVSAAQVQAAINAAQNGDTVVVPAGSATWTSTVVIQNKGITLQGAGEGQTIITRNTPTIQASALTVRPTTGNFIRVTGFTFQTVNSAQNGILYFDSDPAKVIGFRLDHCTVKIAPTNATTSSRGITVEGAYGVIDHCTIINTEDSYQGISFVPGHNTDMAQNWHTPQFYGDMNTVVVEDCLFNFTYDGDGAFDAYDGAKFVFRHNTVIGTLFAWHGADSGPRAPRLFEIYQNTMSPSPTTGTPWCYFRSRGGTGVIWGNTITGGTGSFMILSHFRASPQAPNVGGINPNADGGFDQTYPGQGYPPRYPMLDQVGRGSFPGPNPGGWPNSYPYTIAEYAALEPMYQWGNNFRGDTSPEAGVANLILGPDNSPLYIVKGRDYYDNIAKPGYTSLAYPHPLIAGGTPIGGGPQAPPPPVVPTSTPPTISTIANQTINQDTSTGSIGFTVGDAQSAAENLTVSGTSSNPTLVPNSSIVFGGSGSNRTVTVTPASGQTGASTITVSVSDGQSSASTGFVLTVSAVAAAGATTWYVDKANPASSDSPNNGSESKPWKTITYALGRISGGDTVLVKNGTYNESGLYIYGPSGSPGKETTLAAYPGHSPVFLGAGNTGRWAVDNMSYFTIEGFDISNINQGIYIRNGSHHITVRNNKVHNTGGEIMRVTDNSHDILFEGNEVYDGGLLGGANGEGFYIGTTGDHSYNVTIKNNIVHDTKSEGIELKAGVHDVTIEGNTVTKSNNGIVPAAGIEISESTGWAPDPNIVVRNNVVFNPGSQSHGIRAGAGCTIYNNIVYGLSAGKFAVQVNNFGADTDTRRIYNNTFDVPSAQAVSLGGGTTDIKNNIGPSSPNNIITSQAYYVNAANRDYHLVAGSEPVDAGADLSSIVPVDKDGKVRPSGTSFDMGAYEYVPTGPSPPTNLRIISAQ
jgi:parallel beta-helix repeat protein